MSVTLWVYEILKLTCDKGSAYLSSYAGGHNTFILRTAISFLINEYTTNCLITLDNKFQNLFCICDEYVIKLFVCVCEVGKWTYKTLLGSSFKIMLHYDILRNKFKYYTERWMK